MKNKLKLAILALIIVILGNSQIGRGQIVDHSLYLPYVAKNYDGIEKIAFWALTWPGVGEYPDRSLKVINADGTGLVTLTENSLGGRLHYADWSPDGEKIVYSNTGESQYDYDIFVVNVKQNTHLKLTNSVGEFPYYTRPKWSPDGEKIAFSAGPIGAIYTINPDGTGMTPLLQNLNPSPQNVMWSPDSQQIGFTVGGELFVMNADGTGLMKITSADDFSISVTAWAPTANKIAFDDPGAAVYVINSDGTGLIELPNGMWQPAWSHDSTQIAYICLIEGNKEICIVHADGTGLARIPLEVGIEGLAWSPSGQKLVFTSKWDENEDLYTINIDGTNLTQITSSETDDIMPLWQP